MNFELHSSADLRTFVVKMSRVEFTRFFKTITLILLVFLLVFSSIFVLKVLVFIVFKKMSSYEEFAALLHQCIAMPRIPSPFKGSSFF